MIKSSNVDIFVFVILVIPRHFLTGYMADKKLKALTPVNMYTQPRHQAGEKMTLQDLAQNIKWASHEITNNLCFPPGPTQTDLYSHTNMLREGKFLDLSRRWIVVFAAKTKMLISCAVTAQLICVFVFAYVGCWFSYAAAHIEHKI